MSSSQNGSGNGGIGNSSFGGVNVPPSVTSGQTPQEARQQTRLTSDFIQNTAAAREEDYRASAPFSSEVGLRRRQLEGAGFGSHVAQIASLPRESQVYAPVDLASRVANFSGANLNDPSRVQGDPIYNPERVRDLFLVQRQAVQQQIARQTANTAEDLMSDGSNMDVDDVIHQFVGSNTAFTYDYGASNREIAQALGQHHAQNLAAQAASSLDMVRLFEPNTYSRVSNEVTQRYGTIPRAELLAARGTSAAISEQFNAGMGINTQYYSREAAYDTLESGTYSRSYLEEEIPYYMRDHEPHAIFTEQGLDTGAIASVRTQLGAAGTMAGIVRDREMSMGANDAQASAQAQNAFGALIGMTSGGYGGGGDGGGGGGGGLVPTGGGGGDDGGRPSLELTVVQGQLDTLGATHLQNFATALGDATNQLQLYTGGLPAVADGQDGDMAIFRDPARFFDGIQMSMSNALDAIFRNANGDVNFGGGGGVPQGQEMVRRSVYAQQRIDKARASAEKYGDEPPTPEQEEELAKQTFGDDLRAFFGGMFGRQSTEGDTARSRKLAGIGAALGGGKGGGGLLASLVNKTVGVTLGVGSASDLTGAIGALPFGGQFATPLAVMSKVGGEAANLELPALQAAMTRGTGFYTDYVTKGTSYGDITRLSTQLGISPSAAANMLRDVGVGTQGDLSTDEIAGLVIRGYDPTAVSSLIANVRGSSAGNLEDVLGTMNMMTNMTYTDDKGVARRQLSNAEVMQITQGAAEFGMGRRMAGLGGRMAGATQAATGMLRAGDTSVMANLQTLGRFQGVGVNASKGLTSFATGMLDMALQAYAMNESGGDPFKAQRIIEDLSADPYGMRQAVGTLGIGADQIDLMMLGTGGLTTRDVERSRFAAEGDFERLSTFDTKGTPKDPFKALRASQALAKRSQSEIGSFYRGSTPDKFASFMDKSAKFQANILRRVPTGKQLADLYAVALSLSDASEYTGKLLAWIAGKLAGGNAPPPSIEIKPAEKAALTKPMKMDHL